VLFVCTFEGVSVEAAAALGKAARWVYSRVLILCALFVCTCEGMSVEAAAALGKAAS